MKHINDDEIEVLGYSAPKTKPLWVRSKRFRIIAIIVGIVIISALAFCLLALYDDGPRSKPITSANNDNYAPDAVYAMDKSAECESSSAASKSAGYVVSTTDSINDVVFTMYDVSGLKADVTFDFPEADNTKILVATTAADYRADNKQIVGDFIHNKKRLTSGGSKTGYCYISPTGSVTLGMGEADDIQDKALKEGGTFFRQFPLVMNGQTTDCSLKGKAKRRALGLFDERLMVIKSLDRESIYDFAQALADYGFSHVLYLPGGEGNWHYIGPDTKERMTDYPPDSPYGNFITFQ